MLVVVILIIIYGYFIHEMTLHEIEQREDALSYLALKYGVAEL